MVAKSEYLDVMDGITQAVGDDWNERRARLFIAVRIKSLRKALRDIEADLRFEKAVAERVSETFLQSFRYLREEKEMEAKEFYLKSDTLIYNLYRTLEHQFNGKYPSSIEELMHQTYKYLSDRRLLDQNEED